MSTYYTPETLCGACGEAHSFHPHDGCKGFTTQPCCWSFYTDKHNRGCENWVAPVTINHDYPKHSTYFTARGMYSGPRVERNTATGTIALIGEATNSEWAELLMVSEADIYSVKGTF